MVMDLLHGESLGERLEREPRLPLEQAARILIPAVNAVGTAHAVGIVHRDLKPDNIFLSDEGGVVVVQVLDFGIAKFQTLDGDSLPAGGLTGTGAMLGTPFYMSPEQIFGERDVDQRADVWAIGVILYECLSGVRPTQAENVGQILRILMTESIVPLRLLVPDVPADVAELVGRMLQRDRQQRPGSMAEVQSVLQRFAPDVPTRTLGEPAIPATRASRPSFDEGSKPRLSLNTSGDRAVISKLRDVSPTAATLSSTTASTTADRAAIRRTQSRAPLLVGAALALAVASGSAGVYVATRSAPAASSTPVPVAVPSVTASAPVPESAPPPVPPAPVVAPAASSTTAATASANVTRPAVSPRPVAPRTTAPELHSTAVPSTPARPNAYDHM
jgi:eukaryotic-like serine/threonine-protein kinase